MKQLVKDPLMYTKKADEKTPPPRVERRDFMRMAGTLALGATVMGITSHADTRPNTTGAGESVFKQTKTIPLNLKDPSGMVLCPDGRIFVSGQNTIVEMNHAGNEAARYHLDGQPGCIALNSDGKLMLGMQDQVLLLASDGLSTSMWAQLDDRAHITAIAADEHSIFIADAGNRVVLQFDTSGSLINRIGQRDRDRDIPGLVVPSPYFDVALDPMGALWVVNPGKHGLESYRPDGSLITSWYRPGMDPVGFCGCCNPIHIAFRSDSSLVTVEKGLNRVKVIAPDLTLRGLVSGPRSAHGLRVNLTCTEKPPICGLAVDSDDRILILDTQQNRILFFEEEISPKV